MKAMVVVASLVLAACSGKDSSPPTDTGPEDGPPEIEVSVDELQYEAIAVGTTSSKNITVKNLGRTPLDVESVQVADPFRTTFSYMTLQPSGVGIITVIFAPTANGHSEEVLSVLSTDPNHPSVSVTCVGDTITDADGDGFDAGFDPGQDCDDSNPNINPAAEEIWYNAVDDNCICDFAPRCSDDDQDFDGYDYINENSLPENNGGDCNDVNPDINPGEVDVWYDGYDTNCDGANDNDQDHDGYSSSEHTALGTDCNDLDPDINTEGTETYDGEDDDCNGESDYEILDESTDIVIVGSGNDKFGTGLTSGNLNAFPTSEVIAGAPKFGTTGVITVFADGSFPATGSVGTDTADAVIEGDAGDELGSEIAYLAAFGATGDAHIVVGATNYSSDKGYAAVLLGSEVVAGSSLDESTVLRIEGTTSGANVGQGLANDLDLDGDGYDEVMGSVKDGDKIGLWLFAGDTTLTGVHTTTEADARFDVPGTDTTMLNTFPGGGNDFDGDGYDDFLFCNGNAVDDLYGEVWILWGGTPYSNTSPESIDTAGSIIATGSSTLDVGLVCGSAGDWTDDGAVGKAEVWMYSPSTTSLYLLEGDSTLRDGPVDVAASFLALYPFDSFTNDPAEIRDVGDLDGTTGHEMAISISADSTSVVPGQVYILGSDMGFGDIGVPIETVAQATFWGDALGSAESYGQTISGHAADVTGVGGYRTDIVVADPGYLSDAGAVFVYPNYNE
jgi:hypothetical protein